jgi:hypothetical protein
MSGLIPDISSPEKLTAEHDISDFNSGALACCWFQ